MNNHKSKKISINTRILISNLVLLGIVFLGIALTFNVFINSYIKQSTNKELNEATEAIKHFYNDSKLEKQEDILNNRTNYNVFNRELHHDRAFKFLSEFKRSIENKYDLESMIIDKNYELLFPDKKENFLIDIDKYESILNKIKKNNYSLDSEKNITISTNDGSYSVSIVKIDSDLDIYIVLFINVSNILYIYKMMNIVLIIIMCIAGVLSIFAAILLSNQIGKPIQKLCIFAKNIGEGKFEKCDFDFIDKVLDQLAEAMNKSAEQLDKYDKEQKVFFQNASHELRTPLMSIKGYAEAIKYNVIDKDIATNVILEESNRLTEMVEDLLYISKIDNISKDYVLLECDLRDILSNCVLNQKANAISKGISFKYDFDEKPVLMNCDEKSISRAFLNLIENGLRYAKEYIIVGCSHDEDKITVYIEDDGEGIKESDLPYIFDRFYKGEKGKHGIGLSIVKSIVNKHNGDIFVENTDKGARFTIYFYL